MTLTGERGARYIKFNVPISGRIEFQSWSWSGKHRFWSLIKAKKRPGKVKPLTEFSKSRKARPACDLYQNLKISKYHLMLGRQSFIIITNLFA